MRAAQLAYNYSVNVLTAGLGNWKFKVTQLLPWRFKITEVEAVPIEPPVFVSAILIDLTHIELTFSKALNESIVPTPSSILWSSNIVDEITINGTVVTLLLQLNALYSDTSPLYYTQDETPFQDLAGNAVESFETNVDLSIFPNGSCTDLLLDTVTSDSFVASWINGSTDETAIIAEISEDELTWTETSLPAGTETYTFEGLDASTEYFVRVRAEKNGYYSGYTLTESVTTESAFDPDYFNLITRIEAAGENPSAAWRTAMETAIIASKAAGLFDTQFDVLVITSGFGDVSTKQNIIKNAHHAQGVNNPTRTNNLGYKTNGTSYLRTNYNPNTDKALASINNMSFGILIDNTGVAVAYEGSFKGTALSCIGRNIIGMNGPTSSSYSDVAGYNIASRESSTYVNIYQNALYGAKINTSIAIPDYEAYILCLNNNGTANNFRSTTVNNRLYFWGKAMTFTQSQTFISIWNTFLATYQ